MHSKCFSQEPRTDLVNPFVHRLEIKTTYEKFRTGVLTVVFLPIRLILIIVLLITAWLLAVVGLIGLSQDDLINKPLTGNRKRIKEVIAWVMRSTYQVGGMNVIVRGEQAPREEAPIMVIAPHSTFLDAGIVYITGFPSIICRRESGTNPWLGKLINYTQPIYVRREDPDSRHKTIQEIINRAHSKEDWSQILIFPEGTCTNRSCLITFKSGAFYPGVPIQPVLIRYPNKLDTVTWTWDGPGALKLLWLTLVQPASYCEIEFLPVYYPSDEEKADHKIFANNVRKLMAKHLGVPTLDYTYDDCKLVSRAKMLSFSKSSSLLQAHQLRVKLGLSRSHIEEKLITSRPQYLKENSNNRKVDFNTFTSLLSIDPEDYLASDLFNLYNPDKSGRIDFREYLLSVLLVYKAESKAEMIKLAFELCGGNDMKISKRDFGLIMKMVLDMEEEDSRNIYKAILDNAKEKLSLEKFENYARNQGEFSCIYGGALRRLSLGRENDEKNK